MADRSGRTTRRPSGDDVFGEGSNLFPHIARLPAQGMLLGRHLNGHEARYQMLRELTEKTLLSQAEAAVQARSARTDLEAEWDAAATAQRLVELAKGVAGNNSAKCARALDSLEAGYTSALAVIGADGRLALQTMELARQTLKSWGG